jgi:hypothetical protein
MLPPPDQIRRDYTYDPETGKLSRVSGVRATFNAQPSRIIWAYMTGAWPTLVIDHIDGNRKNNRWDNLRQISHQRNCHNTAKQIGAGAYYKDDMPRSKPWCARIRMPDKSRKILGHFATKEEAQQAYADAHSKIYK